jgi:hypothetical protein
MSGAAYAVRMALILVAAVTLIWWTAMPLLALHPHWDRGWNPAAPFEALFGALFCSGCVWFMILLSVAPFAISVLIAVWIYYDAKHRNDPNAVPWALLGFLLNVIGWIIYLIVRSQPPGAPAGGYAATPPGAAPGSAQTPPPPPAAPPPPAVPPAAPPAVPEEPPRDPEI